MFLIEINRLAQCCTVVTNIVTILIRCDSIADVAVRICSKDAAQLYFKNSHCCNCLKISSGWYQFSQNTLKVTTCI